jgi:hypothetical protein
VSVERCETTSDRIRPEVERAYAAVAQLDTLSDLRRLVAAVYADTDDIDAQRMLMVHLRQLHLRDPAEIGYWRDRTAKKDGPYTLEAARVSVAEALAQAWES